MSAPGSRSRTIVGLSNEIASRSARRTSFEDQAVAGHQLRVAIRHIEEDLDQDLDPGTPQVIQGDFALLLPHLGVVPDQLRGCRPGIRSGGPGACRRAR